MQWDRRSALAALAAAAVPISSLVAAADAAGTKLVLLGTAGGPRVRKNRSGSAQAIVSDGNIYVIDCGYGVVRQMVLAGLDLKRLRHIFITHHHSDHDIDLGPLLQLAWLSGLTTAVDCWGPPPITKMIADYLKYESTDIAVRQSDEGRPPFRPLIRTHEIHGGGSVMRDARLQVTAAKVIHPPMDLALAYRFDASDRSIVISGDTRPSDELIRMAKDADALRIDR